MEVNALQKNCQRLTAVDEEEVEGFNVKLANIAKNDPVPISEGEDSRGVKILSMKVGMRAANLSLDSIYSSLGDGALCDISLLLTVAKRACGKLQPPSCLRLRAHWGS